MTQETDRELLELAAKAADVPAYWSVDGTIQNRPLFVVNAGGKMGTMPYETEWNPLKDDALALRLAVHLEMALKATIGTTTVLVPSHQIAVSEPHGSDACAATRRAITRAAAEIGRTMQ